MHGAAHSIVARASEALGRASMMQPPTIDDIRAAAERIEGAVDPHPDAGQPHPVRDHRRRSLAEVREPAVHRRLQGARRAQQIAAADAGGARARRHRRVGRQPCAGRRLSRQAARHPGDHRHARVHADDEGHPDRGPWRARRAPRRDRSTTPIAQARELERRERLRLRPPVRRPADHRRRGHRRARNARGRARPRHDRRPDRRRRADVRRRDRRRVRSSRTSS